MGDCFLSQLASSQESLGAESKEGKYSWLCRWTIVVTILVFNIYTWLQNIFVNSIVNPKGYQNPISGSKAMAILLKGLI